MVTYCIASDCVALLLPPDAAVRVQELVSESLSSAGLAPWRAAEAELFSCPGGKLLIARPAPPRRRRSAAFRCRKRRN